jgi:CRP-like cAMP-binding protein
MDIEQTQTQQAQALQKAKELIAEGEKKRLRARLLRQVEEFELGNLSVLLHDEFVRNIAQLIVDESHESAHERAGVLLSKLGKYAGGDDGALRERAVMALSFCDRLLSAEDNYELLAQVTSLLAHWLQVETTYLPVCDTVCRQLQQNGLRMLNEGQWQQFDAILDILFQIQSGALDKGNVIRGLAARTQDALAAPHILEELTPVCLHGQGGRQALAERILVRLGRRAVIFLLDKLLVSQQKDERLRLIKLIPATGRVAVPVLKEYLTKELPWYGVRNIVLLVTAMGDATLVPLVLPSLKHKDIRVQQQVIDCINGLAGLDRKRYLLSALSQVDDELKANLISQLGQLGCVECADVFLDLLAERDGLESHVRDGILGQLCMVLRLGAPQQRTLTLLRQLVVERENSGVSKDDTVSVKAQHTLQILEPQLQAPTQAVVKEKPVEREDKNSLTLPAKLPADQQVVVSFDSDLEAEQRARLKLRGLDDKIQKLLQEKKIAEATALIAEHAVGAAKAKDFITAEILQDRMLAVNPNALIEVIRVGEAIEAEKSNAISSHHLSIWNELYDFLDTEAFTALYHCQQFKEYQAEELIVQQGDSDSTLYFINEGFVALTCRHGRKEVFLKRLSPGDIVGVGPFFDVSVWTVTLRAMSAVKIQLLERQAFLGLMPQYPGLESRLSDFCRRSDKVPELLQEAGENRREDARYQVRQIIQNSLLDEKGNPSQLSFNGQVEEMSLGGFSLMIRVSKKENARLLLGRRIVSIFPAETTEIRVCRGEIVGVTLEDIADKEYLVHVRFEQPLDINELKNCMLQWRK